ncbi:MAG: chemotaxis protein CheX [Deltaproteobacteria bacterium]|nr:chemotaxis protein CheX [Deltaproteobacteria bacterium]MCW9050452.1 chemotaxis protein CheX [Deltaproteobacteria bacterium]
MGYAQHIVEATQEIFSSMIMLDAAPGKPYQRECELLVNSISGIIGLAGSTKGLLAIHLPAQTALTVTTAFLGMDVEEIDEDVRDAVGELANMLGGSLKSVLDPSGSDIQLSLPSVIHGEGYSVDCLANAETVTVPFSVGSHNFMVELQMRQEK